MIEYYERKPETIRVVKFIGTNEQEIRDLGATIVFGDSPYGGVYYDFDTFNWCPFRENELFFKDERGLVKTIDQATLMLRYTKKEEA